MQKVTGTTGGGLSLGTRCCLVMPYHDCDDEEDDSDDDVDDDDDNDGDECLHLNPEVEFVHAVSASGSVKFFQAV